MVSRGLPCLETNMSVLTMLRNCRRCFDGAQFLSVYAVHHIRFCAQPLDRGHGSRQRFQHHGCHCLDCSFVCRTLHLAWQASTCENSQGVQLLCCTSIRGQAAMKDNKTPQFQQDNTHNLLMHWSGHFLSRAVAFPCTLPWIGCDLRQDGALATAYPVPMRGGAPSTPRSCSPCLDNR